MKDTNNHIDELLVKHLAGEATEEEQRAVEQWVLTNRDNAAILAQYQSVWAAASYLTDKVVMDESTAWKRMEALLPDQKASLIARINSRGWLRAAAIIILIVGTTSLAYYGLLQRTGNKIPKVAQTQRSDTGNTPLSIIATSEQGKTDTLPDQSIVTLGKHTALTYADTFSTASHRYVALQGDAFFKVKHNALRPFTVKAGRLFITVLGTSFHVKMSADTVEVSVEKGVVAVADEKSSVLLYAGESAILAGRQGTVYKVKNRDTGQHIKTGSPQGSNNKHEEPPAFDINQHPDLIRQLMQDPEKWASILKNYSPAGNDINFYRRVISSVLNDLEDQKIIQRDSVRDFKLDERAFTINGKRQPIVVFEAFKNKYIKEPGYIICLGNYKNTGKGVFLLRKDL